MGKTKSRRVNFLVEPELWDTIEGKAKEYSTTPSDLIREGMDLICSLGDITRIQIKRYALGLGFSEGHVIRNILLRYFAETEEEREVYGPHYHAFLEFVSYEDKPLNEKELFDNLKAHFFKKFSEEIKPHLLEQAEYERAKKEESRKKLEALNKDITKGSLVEGRDSEWTPDAKIPPPQKSKKGQKVKQASRRGKSSTPCPSRGKTQAGF